ncbi:putative peptidase family-domain-containing protein [Mariannaea sp. PMI_226]|nr:putative peptidase family-domain-containing protein [Mariannaea sp. PMI_226]
MFTIDNIQDGEVVHQRCLLITGQCKGFEKVNDGFVQVETKGEGESINFPTQRWPLCHGWFKSLVILQSGENIINFIADSSSSSSSSKESPSLQIRIRYIPLLQTPPLHLAILVAKDSPLLIDCPPRKFGALSKAHSGLEAAIAKFRLSAYMWQALTAEELRANGLGRRSFRLEEEWAQDTLSQSFARDLTMQSTAKVHLVRTERTVAEIQDIQRAQQNPSASDRDALHDIFSNALKAHGAPFFSESKPVVAGLILDSKFDSAKGMIVGHAALGAHNPNGLSLGIFGSHLTYSWPRFLEEVTDCLLDASPPGDLVGNDNGECASMWEACAVGQGAFLHEVGHAFSAPHTTGIMARGYSPDWPKAFLSRTSERVKDGSKGIEPVTPDTPNGCHWDVRDQLRFLNLPHFRIPSDPIRPGSFPNFEVNDEDGATKVIVSCEAGIGQVLFNGVAEAVPSFAKPETSISYSLDQLESRFGLEKPLEIELIAMNGKHITRDVAKLLSSLSYIRVPGSGLRLEKSSIGSENVQNSHWQWAVMFKKRGRDGALISASKLDLKVGCVLDGVIVHYKDGSAVPCGPRGRNGKDVHMGGHQSRKIALPRNTDIVKVAIARRSRELVGVRVWLSNGKAMGALNKDGSDSVETLVPGNNQRVIGFYGHSEMDGFQSCSEFGIVTAPKDQEVPDSVYDLAELQNSPEDGARSAKRRKIASASLPLRRLLQHANRGLNRTSGRLRMTIAVLLRTVMEGTIMRLMLILNRARAGRRGYR